MRRQNRYTEIVYLYKTTSDCKYSDLLFNKFRNVLVYSAMKIINSNAPWLIASEHEIESVIYEHFLNVLKEYNYKNAKYDLPNILVNSTKIRILKYIREEANRIDKKYKIIDSLVKNYAPDPAPEILGQKQEQLKKVLDLMPEVPARQKNVISLILKGWAISDIAKKLRITDQRVYGLFYNFVSYARRRFATEIGTIQ